MSHAPVLVTDSGNGAGRTFTLASRASKLAQIQTLIARDQLVAAYPDKSFATLFMSTEGDKNQSQALYLLGGKALWTKELEVSLLDKDVDMIVHSLKDVPTSLPAGCEIGAILEREEPVDSLVMKDGLSYKSLDELPAGSVIGTSSVRRVAQLRKSYPLLKFADVRGNLNTRFAKLDSPTSVYSALILAKAGVVRLGMGHRITSDIIPPTLYHAVGQGALAVEIRSNDAEAKELCKTLTHLPTALMCRAERAMLRVLEGGCSVPVGVSTSLKSLIDENSKATLTITGTVTSIDGSLHVDHTLSEDISTVEDAELVGENLARILMETGAKQILYDIIKDRSVKQAALSEKPVLENSIEATN